MVGKTKKSEVQVNKERAVFAENMLISDILDTSLVYIIPPYQRNYEWSKEECKELFEDILNTCSFDGKNKNIYLSHYIGNIICYNGKHEECLLVDGQQRLTTIILLLCALRDYVKDHCDESEREEFVKSVNSLMINTKNDKIRIILKQTALDEEKFNSIINEEKNKTNEKNKKNKSNIISNYNHLSDLVKKAISAKCEKDAKNILDVATEIFKAIKGLELIYVTLTAPSGRLKTAQTFFEKINSAGKPLTPTDLIRNFLLLAENSKKQDELHKKWKTIENNLSTKEIGNFLRHYLILYSLSQVDEKKLYKKFRDFFNDAEKDAILENLSKFSKYYKLMLDENSEIPSDLKTEKQIKRSLAYIRKLGDKEVAPLCLYLLNEMYDKDNKKKEELSEILKLISDFLTRYRIVRAYKGGGPLQSVVRSILEKLILNQINLSHDDIHSVLSEAQEEIKKFPSNNDFIKKLKDPDFEIDSEYAKVILHKIEYTDFENDVAKDSNSDQFSIDIATIEHIFPKTPSKIWYNKLGKEATEEIKEKYVQNFGNLTLLAKGDNSQIKNDSWSEKSKVYEKSLYQITNLSNKTYKYKYPGIWNKDAIIKRGKYFAKKAVKSTKSPLNKSKKKEIKIIKGLNRGRICYKNSDIYIDIEGNDNYLAKICELVYKINSKKFEQIVDKNSIHKAISKKTHPEYDPIIVKKDEIDLLTEPIQITDSDFYVEDHIGKENVLFFVNKLLKLYEIKKEDISIKKIPKKE